MVICMFNPLTFADPKKESPHDSVHLEPAKPLPSVLAFAQAHHLVLYRIDQVVDHPAASGDLAVLLVALFDGPVEKQWLIELEVADLTREESGMKPPPNWVVYTSSGNRLEFKYAPLALQIRTHGPFTEGQSTKGVETKSARALVNREHLSLGFNKASAAFIRISDDLSQAHDTTGTGFSFAGKPFPADVIQATKIQTQRVGITADDERALVGAWPALASFFDIAQKCAGLREILWEVIDLPSAWSVLKKGGRVEPFFEFDGKQVAMLETPAGTPRLYLYPVRLLLNGKLAISPRFVVTTPSPPLLTTAGILGLYADHPIKPEKHVAIQVMSAKTAPEPKANSAVIIQR